MGKNPDITIFDITIFPGGWGTSYNGIDREAPPERGTFIRLQVKYKRVGISQVVLYKRVGKIGHLGI